MSPTRYVLDGQQRLTVIYSAFGAAIEQEGFFAYFDHRGDRFHSGRVAVPQTWQFPLRLVYRTTELLNFRTSLQALSDHAELQSKLDALIASITGYKLPLVELRDLTVTEVCPIFERINSSGTKLSTFDLIAAATWTTDFDLSDQADYIAASIAPKGFSGIDKDTTLKIISSTLLSSVRKEDILGLRKKPKSEIVEATDQSKKSLLLAVDHLYSEFKMSSMSFLPYEAHLLSLSKVYSALKQLDHAQNIRLRQWFWRTSFSQRFRGASETFVSNGIEDCVNWVINGLGRVEDFGRAPTAEDIKKTDFHFRAAVAKAFTLLLTKRTPKNLTNGVAIDLIEALSNYNRKQFHHIYPQAYLSRVGSTTHVNSLANICMLAAAQNNVVSDEDPNVYMPLYFEGLGDGLSAVLSANLLPNLSIEDYRVLSFEDFLDARASIIADYALELCDGLH